MRVVDLSHTIVPNMPVHPGTEPPSFVTANTYDDVGYLEKKITMCSHTGTHLDAPAHMIRGAKTLDQFPIQHFVGRAKALNLTGLKRQAIDISNLEPYGNSLRGVQFVLLHTGWNRLWGTEDYFSGYPVLSTDAAAWLGGLHLKGIGIDMISIDRPGSLDFPIHKILLARDTIIIENLTNLQALPESDFTFCCFPLSIEQGDGSPVRATAIIS